MTPDSPLDRAVWSALSGRQADVALAHGVARRYHPAFGCFAAVATVSDAGLAALAALAESHGELVFLEAAPPAAVPGTTIVSQDAGVQMVARRLSDRPMPDIAIVPLGDADGPAMLALATLTRPGPFFEKTHRLGEFVGVKVDGRLVAMAGERLKPDAHVEVSGLCTHPDHRGRGIAGALLRVVAERILARGETPFLHAYASNRDAIALYGRLGFAVRREVTMTRLART